MSIEEIRNSKEEINKLEEQKSEKVREHRDKVEELESLGVSEKERFSNKRSKTYREVIGPIEDEIKSIAEEISSIKENNDIKDDKLEILKKRFWRLDEIIRVLFSRVEILMKKYNNYSINEDQIWKTEEGKKLKDEINRAKLLKQTVDDQIQSFFGLK